MHKNSYSVFYLLLHIEIHLHCGIMSFTGMQNLGADNDFNLEDLTCCVINAILLLCNDRHCVLISKCAAKSTFITLYSDGLKQAMSNTARTSCVAQRWCR